MSLKAFLVELSFFCFSFLFSSVLYKLITVIVLRYFVSVCFFVTFLFSCCDVSLLAYVFLLVISNLVCVQTKQVR